MANPGAAVLAGATMALERSRLFIARALLQDTELVVLDESFAALDLENLERAMRCVKKRARCW